MLCDLCMQVLGKVYAILSDKDKRAIYDEDGTVDEEEDSILKQDRDWAEYWRLLFSKVTTDDIQSFEQSYKGSEEELDTLKSVYMDSEGDMDTILEEVTWMCSLSWVYKGHLVDRRFVPLMYPLWRFIH